MKTRIKLLTYLMITLLVMTAFSVYSYAADSSDVTFTDVLMNVGTNETERNLAWYADFGADAYVLYGKDGTLDKTATAVCNKTVSEGLYSYKATLMDIEPGTWTYRLVVGETTSEDYTFEVYDTTEGLSFAFISDAQVSNTSHADSWTDTLQKIKASFSDISFVVSGGDQTSNPMYESEFGYFISPELSTLAVSTTVGPPHDNSVLYDKHYNLPNLSSVYGISNTSSDYFYKYSNVLFMHLNVENTTYSEHIEFVEKTIAENPDCSWRVVVIHFSFLSGGSHSKDASVLEFRENLAGPFNELGVDLVLSGHDHTYTRSNLMLDGSTVSSDVVTSNTVTDPEGTLYVCSTAASIGKFYDVYYEDDAEYIAYHNGDNRKGAVIFDVTDTTLSLNTYFLDEDTPELIDSFTINKTEQVSDTIAESYTVTYVTDHTLSYGDDISAFNSRTFTTLTPDAPVVPVPEGSIEEGTLYSWSWKYYLGDGTEAESFEFGNEYTAFLVAEETPVSDTMYIGTETIPEEMIYTWLEAFTLASRCPGQHITFKLNENITIKSTEPAKFEVPVNITLDLNGKALDMSAIAHPIRFIPGSGGASFNVVTSTTGGSVTAGSTSMFYPDVNYSTINIGIGSADTEDVSITGKYLVYGSTRFRTGATLNLTTVGGEYDISSGVIFVNNSSTTTTANNYKLSFTNSTFNFSGSSSCIVRRNADGYKASASSFINATGCTFKDTYTSDNSSSRYLIRYDVWGGTANFTDCDLIGMSIGKTVDGEAIKTSGKLTMGEGTTFKNSASTFNDTNPLSFFSSKVVCADGCVIARTDADTVEIVKAENVVEITWANPVGFTEYWKKGATPVYTGADSFTAGENAFSLVLSEVPVEATENKTYSFVSEEGFIYRQNGDTWQISTDGGETFQDITEDGEIEVKYVLTVSVDDTEKKYTAVSDFMAILTEYSTADYENKEVNITLGNNLSFTSAGSLKPASGCCFNIDLAGYTLTQEAGDRIYLDRKGVALSFFSSEEGGQLVFSDSSDCIQPRVASTVVFGSEQYKNNLTVTANNYFINMGTPADGSVIEMKYLYSTFNCGGFGLLRLNAVGAGAVTLKTEITGSKIHGSTSLFWYNSSTSLSATTNGGVFTADSYINCTDSSFARTTTNPKDLFGNANFTDRYFGKVSFENCSFDTYIINGDLIYSDAALSYNTYYDTLTNYYPAKAITVGEGCVFRNYGTTFNSALDGFTASNVSLAENCELLVKDDYIMVVPTDGVVIDLGEKQTDTNVRYVEIDGAQTEVYENLYIVPEADKNLLVEVTEKASSDTAEIVKSEYYFVDVTAKTYTKLSMDSYMTTDGKKSIRTNEPMGIRFRYSALKSSKNEVEEFVIDEIGFIVAVTEVLGEEELTLDFSKYVTGVAYNKADGTDIVFDRSDDTADVFTCVVRNIPISKYKTNLTCKTYTKMTVGGQQFVVYGEPTTGNIYDTANKLLETDPENTDLIKIVLDADYSIGIDIGDLYD